MTDHTHAHTHTHTRTHTRTHAHTHTLPPQLANQCGSAFFFYLLGVGDISSVVPTANAVSVLFTALADVALGERYDARWLVPGLVLIAAGVLLTSPAA
jgi:uncharacterized membrane protein